jgi:hypothetical protein
VEEEAYASMPDAGGDCFSHSTKLMIKPVFFYGMKIWEILVGIATRGLYGKKTTAETVAFGRVGRTDRRWRS